MSERLPRLLVVDDLFGRRLPGGRNEDRANLCGQFLLRDVTGDEGGESGGQRVRHPTAEVMFARGQTPIAASVGDVVENDLEGSLGVIGDGWETSDSARRWALVLLDLCFYTGRVTPASDARCPGMPEGRPQDDDPRAYFGLTLLRQVHARWPTLPVVILSSKEREEVSREFAAAGALGFVPRSGAESPKRLREYIWRHGLIPDGDGEILGGSLPVLLALRDARRAATSNRHVLVRGERGSGKELLARYLHQQSAGKGGRPFVVVNAATLNPNLFASELFGHVRGAFTGADSDRTGCLVEADGGDLFLDEIGSLPPDVQSGLLRALDSGEVTPVGGRSGRTVTVRVLSATNEPVEARAERGSFRADLLDRLREGGTITLPPLRERFSDIPRLAERFVRDAERACGGMEREISPEALDRLQAHPWPGNVRQLRTCLFEAVRNHADVEHLMAGHLPRLEEPPRGESALLRATAGGAADRGGLEPLIDALSRFNFGDLEPQELMGQLPRLEKTYADLMARYLGAALRTQVRHTQDAPEGKLLIHPALVLATGASSLAATKAYDLIIKLRHLSSDAVGAWDRDPLLRAAYEKAMERRRPKARR